MHDLVRRTSTLIYGFISFYKKRIRPEIENVVWDTTEPFEYFAIVSTFILNSLCKISLQVCKLCSTKQRNTLVIVTVTPGVPKKWSNVQNHQKFIVRQHFRSLNRCKKAGVKFNDLFS